ncbi:hypothetical protein PUR23_15930 [Methylorubrum populi]|uniref:ABC transporter ATPase n=1 Tax=Methylorubrum thiocyanatum TaxID=47958 RepID=A0AA40RZS6_9HYPH|nr:hypothetical protein [Methylorubrum thiocyanatum]MBA8911743.1 hypothetical protein [Methylorubrum thiocyanatum]GJE79963.1 hypothetical protein CJNNKLLH_1294 [Methylorubrum thiocyanatum]
MAPMRRALALLLVLAASPAMAEESCTDLIDRVQRATGAAVAERSADFARFEAGPQTSLTLSCAGADASSVGAQYRGETPPEAYDTVFVQAGHAITGIAPDRLRDATRQAREGAQAKRHSTIEVDGARVTCAFMRKEQGPLTLCAVIQRPGA